MIVCSVDYPEDSFWKKNVAIEFFNAVTTTKFHSGRNLGDNYLKI